MLQISPNAQYRPTARPQQRQAWQTPVVRFGEIPDDKLERYQKQIHKIEEIKKYKPPSFREAFKVLAPEGIAGVEKNVRGVSDTEVERMCEQKAWEPIEESSDMFFELYTLHALRKDIINPNLVDSWRKKYLPPDDQRKKVPFRQLMESIAAEIPPEKIKEFQKTVSWDERKSRDILTLIAAKFVLMRNRDPKYDLWKESKPLLMGEAKEFCDTFSWYSPRKLQIYALAFAYTHFPFLPMEWFRAQIASILSHRLNTKLHYQDLMTCVYNKQMRRQAFDYRNPEFKTNRERKRYVKQLEVMDACVVWKKARLMNSPFL